MLAFDALLEAGDAAAEVELAEHDARADRLHQRHGIAAEGRDADA